MTSLRNRNALMPVRLALMAVLCTLCASLSLHAQATAAASKTVDIAVFAGGNYIRPDFGPDNNYGTSFGANFTRYIHLPIAPSLEVRYNYASGTGVKERTILGGLRAQYDRKRFHPYVDLLFGQGKITYVQPLANGATMDSGTAFSYGGGVDITVYRQFDLKADLQLQSWNLGINSFIRPQGGDFTLSPTVVLIGVSYRIPFRAHTRQGDYR